MSYNDGMAFVGIIGIILIGIGFWIMLTSPFEMSNVFTCLFCGAILFVVGFSYDWKNKTFADKRYEIQSNGDVE